MSISAVNLFINLHVSHRGECLNVKGLELLMSILFASVVLRVVVLFVNEGIFQL